MGQAIVYFTAALLVHCTFAHMPTVYEFCSHVVSRGEVGRTTCDARQCHGRPGKVGQVGPRGIQGFKGQKGERGTSKGLEERLRILEGVICYMGMKNGEIPDSAVSTSSDHDQNHAGRLARLDAVPSGYRIGAWSSKYRRVGEWIQVDFGESKLVAGLITQGRPFPSAMQWVSSYKVSCGNSVGSLAWIMENGVQKVFAANNDRDTKVVNKFPNPTTCRYIRVYPLTWHNWMTMRVEFIRGTCYDLY